MSEQKNAQALVISMLMTALQWCHPGTGHHMPTSGPVAPFPSFQHDKLMDAVAIGYPDAVAEFSRFADAIGQFNDAVAGLNDQARSTPSGETIFDGEITWMTRGMAAQSQGGAAYLAAFQNLKEASEPIYHALGDDASLTVRL
jgi:hypothetical protein